MQQKENKYIKNPVEKKAVDSSTVRIKNEMLMKMLSERKTWEELRHDEHKILKLGENWERYVNAKIKVVDLLKCRILESKEDFNQLV